MLTFERNTGIKLRLIGEYVLTELGDEIIACSVDESTPRIITLNETGVVLWRLLEKGCSEDELITSLCDEFDVTETQARNDVFAFIDTLHSSRIITY